MTDLVGELRSRRLVQELDPIRRPGAGRPTRPIALDGDPWWVMGIHINSDHVRFHAATVGGLDLWSDSVQTDLHLTGNDVGSALFEELLRAQLDRAPGDRELVAIEVGLSAYVQRDGGTVSWAAELDWRDLPLASVIDKTLTDLGMPDVHVSVSNDCQLAALYAARMELGLPVDSVAAYLGGSRGVGSAIIIDGEIFRGANGGAGDLAHTNVDPTGPEDWCGRRGCLESLAGPRRLLSASNLLSVTQADELLLAKPEEAIQRLEEAAAAGHPQLLAVLARAADALGRAIDDIIGALNPQTVILGGYLGALSAYLLAPIDARIADRVEVAAFSATSVTALPLSLTRVVHGATLAARDVCLNDPLTLTRPVAS